MDTSSIEWEMAHPKPVTFAEIDAMASGVALIIFAAIAAYKLVGNRATRKVMWLCWAVALGLLLIPHLFQIMYALPFGAALGVWIRYSMYREEFKYALSRVDEWYKRDFSGKWPRMIG